ncbi:MAG: cell division protein ZapA [Pseudomonadota bacterium]
MPEVNISIGGRMFDVACQEGEQQFLIAAAEMLDAEASSLTDQIGRMPEARLLLMSGLMLADKFVGIDDQIRQLELTVASQQALIEELKSQPAGEIQRVEVPVIPAAITHALGELTAQAEALAQDMEEATPAA